MTVPVGGFTVHLTFGHCPPKARAQALGWAGLDHRPRLRGVERAPKVLGKLRVLPQVLLDGARISRAAKPVRVGHALPVILRRVNAHHVTVRPFRLREHDDLLAVDKLRGVGYRAQCSCGWRSQVTGEHREARALGREHTTGGLGRSVAQIRTTPAA